MDVVVRARVTAVVLEAVLWVALVSVAVTRVVRPVVGPAILGLGQGPYWGAAPHVPARVSDSVWQQAVNAMGGDLPPVLTRGLVGGPFERGEMVEATLPNQADVSVWAPMTFRQTVGVAGAEIAAGLAVAAALVLAILVVRDLRRGELFDRRNLQRVYAIAAVVGVGGMGAEIAGAWGRVGVLQSPRIADYVVADWTVSFAPLITGLAIACGAEAVRLGMRLRSDVEGLV